MITKAIRGGSKTYTIKLTGMSNRFFQLPRDSIADSTMPVINAVRIAIRSIYFNATIVKRESKI